MALAVAGAAPSEAGLVHGSEAPGMRGNWKTVSLAAPIPPPGLSATEFGSAGARGPLPLAAPLRRYMDAPPAGFSGGFGESACDACHYSYETNDHAGSLRIEGIPERFVPGERYPIVLTLTRPGMALAGFQVTARFQADGAQAGVLAPAPEDEGRVAAVESMEVRYLHHREAGTTPVAPDTARWDVLWTAPAEGPGTVLFHASGNVADGDGSAGGDYVYQIEASSAP